MQAPFKSTFVLATFTWLLLVGLTLPSTSKWELEKEGEGIQIYTRLNEGSPIKEFKAITTTTQSMETLVTIIDDVEKYPEWQENVSTATILKKVDSLSQYIHYSTEMPWPIDNRDIVVLLTKSVSNTGTVNYVHISKPDYVKEKENHIRIKVAKGSWTFTPLKDNKVKVVYQFFGDPGGHLPDWLINTFIVNGPYGTLKNLIKLK